MNRRRSRAAALIPGAPVSAAVLMPGAAAGEWELCRAASRTPLPPDAIQSGVPGITRQVFATLDAAAANLQPAEPFVLALPIEMGLVQRLALPAAEPSELEEMARIQLEKILPYPADAVGMVTQEISRNETDVILAVETVYYDRLTALCQPLAARGCWPLRVVFQSLALAGGVAGGENSAFLYRENGRYVLGICENGRLGFAQALGASAVDDLAAELPAVLLGAELDGVPAAFSVLRLDAREGDAAAVLAAALNVPVAPFDTAAAALASVPVGDRDGDLSPAQWRVERQRGERLARIRRRVLLGAAIYAGVLLLALLWLGMLKWQVRRLDARLEKLRPLATASQEGAARWKTLSPAVEWPRFLVETVNQVFECLPPGDSVRLTAFDQTERGIALQGEAPSPTAAVDFVEKLRARPELKLYHFEDSPPSPLPNGRARFRITGDL